MIKANKLRKIYANGQGLHGITFAVEKGEFIGVLGRSGAGKTTLLRLLCGAIFPASGSLTIFDRDMTNITRGGLSALRRRIATVYQNFNVVPSLDVARNILLGRLGRETIFGAVRSLLWLNESEREELDALLTELGIADKVYERCQELSGGQQQRVAIARALYSRADLILADEPIASVDPVTATLILSQFQSLQQQGKTVILNLHQVSSAVKYCSRLIMLENGCIVYDGPAKEFEAAGAYRSLTGIDGSGGGNAIEEAAELA
jgi:phosphonate transport system ATP-binding protein